MSDRIAAIGVSDHNGWAVLVTAGGDGSLIERRRVDLVAPDLPEMPYHHDAQGLPLGEAEALIGRVRESADHYAKLALEAVADVIPGRIVGVSIRRCPPIPDTVAGRLRDYRAQNVADTVMYRNAVARAAQARGWDIQWYDARKVIDAAAVALGVADGEAHFVGIRKSAGPPWARDHRIAMAAAIVALQGR